MLTKPRVSLVREDIGDDSQTFFYESCICHRTGSQSWTIHNPRKNAYTLRLLPIQLHVRGSCVVFGRHVTKQPSDWSELFVMARTKESAQRYQTTFFAAILLAEVVGRERDYVTIFQIRKHKGSVITPVQTHTYVHMYTSIRWTGTPLVHTSARLPGLPDTQI